MSGQFFYSMWRQQRSLGGIQLADGPVWRGHSHIWHPGKDSGKAGVRQHGQPDHLHVLPPQGSLRVMGFPTRRLRASTKVTPRDPGRSYWAYYLGLEVPECYFCCILEVMQITTASPNSREGQLGSVPAWGCYWTGTSLRGSASGCPVVCGLWTWGRKYFPT